MAQSFKNEKAFLNAYDIHDFDVPLATVDMAIFSLKEGELCVLLIKRAQYPSKGKWALPGGFIDLKKDKTLEDTAQRKLYEKTGVQTSYLEQVATIGNKSRDPRGWSMTVVYFALIDSDHIVLEKNESAEEISWLPVKHVLEELKLAFDHQNILDMCFLRLKNKVQYSSLAVNLLPEEFTLTELQKTFEMILGQSIEKKSFRRRFSDANILEETGNMRVGHNRPAKLYRAKNIGENHFFPRGIEGPRE